MPLESSITKFLPLDSIASIGRGSFSFRAQQEKALYRSAEGKLDLDSR
jgi:hypothetical protein